jgi:hypothetical protein
MTTAGSPFDTPLTLTGPLRGPRQMLEEQVYDGHKSIHDDETAEKLGFAGAPIEGPTHFSQFEPLAVQLWGEAFYERGCFSAHYLNMVVEGEQVRASVRTDGEGRALMTSEKEDGTAVLEGTATLGPDHGHTALDARRAKLRPHGDLVILRDMKVGDSGPQPEPVRMGFEQHLGDWYPFTLAQKLERITERCSWHTPEGGAASPWGRPIVPFEMISALTQYTVEQAAFKVRTPNVGLFADLEIRMIEGPVFVDTDYVLQREVVALSESRRTESYWTLTRVLEAGTDKHVADVLLNHAIMKDSFPGYDEERG